MVVQGGKVGLLPGLAQEVVQEMRAERCVGLVFDSGTLRFASKGEVSVDVDTYTGAVISDEEKARASRAAKKCRRPKPANGLKLQKIREEQVVANAKQRGLHSGQSG